MGSGDLKESHIADMPWVLFFDGECDLCSRSVSRLARLDREGRIHYAPLQGELASKHELDGYLEGDQASMVLLDRNEGILYTQSDSLLQIMRLLGGPWRLLLVFGALPKSFRNSIYRWIANNRQRWFGRSSSAREFPDEHLKSRMIE